MKFLLFFIVFAVSGNHVITAAPKPEIDIRIRDDVRAVLRHILLKVDQTTLDKWLGLDRDSEERITTTKPREQGTERLATLLTLITEAPELLPVSQTAPPIPSAPPGPPAPQKLIIHPLCVERLNNPNRIEDINDIQNRHDVIEYLIYRLCLPTVTADDVLAVSDIVDRLSSPDRMPVIGLPNPFVPEVQTLIPEVQTLNIDIDLLQGGAVTDLDQELATMLLDEQEVPRTRMNDFDPDINDEGITTIADDDQEVELLEESDDDIGILQNFLLQVDRTFTTWFHLKRQDEEEDEDEGDKEDVNIFEEPLLAIEEPVVSTDAAYLMTTSLPVAEEPLPNPLCKDRLNNPKQIENIADVQNRYDVIEYLIYRLCLPTATAEDVEAVATIVEQLSWPVEVKPKPMFEPDVEPDVEPQPVVKPEVHPVIIDNDLLQAEDGAVLDQELATKPLDVQDEAVTQAAPLASDNDTDNDEADDIQLIEDTTSALSDLDQSRTDIAESSKKIEENTQKNMQENRPAEQEQNGTPTSSTSAESDEDDVEENDAAQPLDIDSDELELRIRELLDSLMS